MTTPPYRTFTGRSVRVGDPPAEPACAAPGHDTISAVRPLQADASYNSFKTRTDGSLLVDPRDGRTSAATDRPDVRSVPRDSIAARRTSPSVRLLHLHVCARRMAERCPDQSSRRSTTWRELTSYFLLRPRGASLLAQTGRCEQGDVRSQSRWPRLDLPPPPFHRTHGLRRTTCGMAAASRGSHDRGRVKLSRTASKPM